MALLRIWNTTVHNTEARHLKPADSRFPGLDLARLADLPDDVLVEARRVSEKLTELEERKVAESQSNKISLRRKALLRVKRALSGTFASTGMLTLARFS